MKIDLPASYATELAKFKISPLGRLANSLSQTEGEEYLNSREKKCLEVIATATLLMVTGILYIPVSIINHAEMGIKLTSAAMFTKKRVSGKKGEVVVYKFRTMTNLPGTIDEPNGLLATDSAQQNRITRFGKLLRDSDLDEAPQSLNAFFNEMTILGPMRLRDPLDIDNVAGTDQDKGRRWRSEYLSLEHACLLSLAGLDPQRKEASGRNIQLDLWEVEHASFVVDIFKIWNFTLNHLGLKSLDHLNPYA